jgi:hypothetical protein
VLTAEAAIFTEFQFLWLGLLVLGCGVISLLALSAGKGDDISHRSILCMDYE